MRKQIMLFLEIIVMLGGPLVLMGAESQILASRPLLMAIGGFYCCYRLTKSRASLNDIGLTGENFAHSFSLLIKPSLILIAISSLIIIFVPHQLRLFLIGQDPLTNISLYERIFLYIFASAPIQELIFRGYFTYRLQQVFDNNHWIRTLSVAVFTLAHLPFRSPIMIFVSFSMGIMYTNNYLKYKNLFTVAIAHGLVGGALMILRNYYLPY